MGQDKIELLSVDLLKSHRRYVKIVDYWCNLLNLQLGWSYILDISWLLKKIDELKLPKGAVIMDAGAGSGVIQFIIASKGYNVLSVDFSDRQPLSRALSFFEIEQINSDRKFDHNYVNHLISLRKELKEQGTSLEKKSVPNKFRQRVNRLKDLCSIAHYKEKAAKFQYGKLKYYKADIRQMDYLEDNSIDCIVSVSAVEHNDHKGVKDAVCEFIRILKSGSPMFITTSATDREDWFHEPCKGWCFSEKSLKELFCLDNPGSNFRDFDTIFDKLKANQEMRARLADFYYRSGNNGMPWGIWDPEYQPVGIVKIKQQ
ncbi:methyltransferase domain-containing protein [bacterium]|nr:methyltransferase domain-containing protein [bacterium]MBU1616033.1 methyltransferase domain-containing protein [bacterium]